jgi:hypothetical protein
MIYLLAAATTFVIGLRYLSPSPATKIAPVVMLVVASAALLGPRMLAGSVFQSEALSTPRKWVEQFVALAPAPAPTFSWPPKLDEPYPDLQLTDENGSPVRLSDFKGKIILLELVGLPCKACQAYAGGHQFGPFQSVRPQQNLESIEKYARRFGAVDLKNKEIVYVQLLLYGTSSRAPTLDEAKAWAKHFRMQRSDNRLVLVGAPSMVSPESYAMIPGFHLIDRNFILRRDAAGHQPTHNLYSDLLPELGRMRAGAHGSPAQLGAVHN